ncbi:MAG: Lon-insertion domain-containing protein [Candidatus Micrarchaeia archaeon]
MEETKEKRKKFIRFIAQEINKDKRIPHADKFAVRRILEEAKRRAKIYDGKDGITLRLREISGIIKLAGDLAIIEKSEFIEEKHVKEAIEKAKSVEQQVEKRYGSRYTYPEYYEKKPQDYII